VTRKALPKNGWSAPRLQALTKRGEQLKASRKFFYRSTPGDALDPGNPCDVVGKHAATLGWRTAVANWPKKTLRFANPQTRHGTATDVA
jgi:hypothetical protein